MGPRLQVLAVSCAVGLGGLLATTAACGSSASGAGTGGNGSATNDGGSSTPSTPNGGAPTSSGGSTPPSASTTPADTSGGSAGTPGAGTTSAGLPGGTPSTGAGGAAPSPADPCQGLVAAPDAGRVIEFGTGTHRSCARATSDPSGQLAFGIAGGSAPSEMAFQLYGRDGTQVGAISVYQTSNDDIDPWFHWTSLGYAGLVHDGSPPFTLRSFDRSGGVLATTSDYVTSSAPDGHGGTVALARSFDSSISPPFGLTRLTWLGPSGETLRTALLDQAPSMLIVNWTTDHVLTLLPSLTGLRARWYDAAGVPLTAWFDTGAQPSGGDGSLHLLVDGSVAFSDGRTWWGTFRDGVDRMDPPPAWLAARPGTRLATVRQGRAYAVLPFPTSSMNMPDQTSVEILTASGQSCGKVALPAHAADPGVTPVPTALDVGQDGTLIQTEMLNGAGGFGIHCGFRWWPELLK